MTPEENAIIIGLYRQGATWEEIGYIMGISPSYAESIVLDYLKKLKK